MQSGIFIYGDIIPFYALLPDPMNLIKTQILLWIWLIPFCIISLATIGVCVFCAVTSVAALFIYGGCLYAEKN